MTIPEFKAIVERAENATEGTRRVIAGPCGGVPRPCILGAAATVYAMNANGLNVVLADGFANMAEAVLFAHAKSDIVALLGHIEGQDYAISLRDDVADEMAASIQKLKAERDEARALLKRVAVNDCSYVPAGLEVDMRSAVARWETPENES